MTIKQVFWRFLKVVYVLLLLFGLLVGWFVWTISKPYSYTTYSYRVDCDNGKVFDPTSKPILHKSEEPYEFLVTQINSECKYGHAGSPDFTENIAPNFTIEKQTYVHIISTKEDQIRNILAALVIYYLLLEITGRTFLYIFFGKSFLPFRKSK